MESAAPRLRSLLSTIAAPRARSRVVARATIATLSSIAAAIIMRSWSDHIPAALWIPTALLLAAGVLALHGEVGSQLIARSVWWSNLVLGTVICFAGSARERPLGLALAITTGAALLAMGRLGLDEDDRSSFRPVAFRTTLTLGMIMAVADAQALTLFGAIALSKERASTREQGALLLLSAILLVIAIIGLYRLRVWGLLLAGVGAIVVGLLAITRSYGFDGAIANGLALTSLAQILLPIPVVVAIVRGRAPAADTGPSRLARAAPIAVILAMIAVSAASVLSRPLHSGCY